MAPVFILDVPSHRFVSCHLCCDPNVIVCGIIWASSRENLSSGAGEQQMRRPACASAQSDQRLCYSLFEKCHM